MIMHLFCFYHVPSFHLGAYPFAGDDPYTKYMKVQIYQSKENEPFYHFGTIDMIYSDFILSKKRSFNFQMCTALQTFYHAFPTCEDGVLSINDIHILDKSETNVSFVLQKLFLFLHAQKQIQHIIISPKTEVSVGNKEDYEQNIYEQYGFLSLSSTHPEIMYMKTIQTHTKLTIPISHLLQEKQLEELMFVYSSREDTSLSHKTTYLYHNKQKSKQLFENKLQYQ